MRGHQGTNEKGGRGGGIQGGGAGNLYCNHVGCKYELFSVLWRQ